MKKSAAAQAREKYTGLHEGLPPKKVKEISPPRTPKFGVEMGKVEAIEYRKRRKTSRGKNKGKVSERSYRHDFAPDAEPVLWHDDQGDLHFREGNYTVTEHGIVDMKSKKKIKYANPAWGVAAGGGGPQRGAWNLYDWAKVVGIVGGVAAGATLAGSYLVDRTDMKQENKGIALLLAGTIGGIGMAPKYPIIASGVAIGGFVSGAMVLSGFLRTRSLQSQLGGGGLQGLRSQQLQQGTQPQSETSAPIGQTRSTGAIV